LAKRGDRVVGIEQFEVGHARGSSQGFSRAIRLCYYEHPDYVPLLRRAYELWHELERESGAKLLYMTGGLDMGAGACELGAGAVGGGSVRAAREHGLPHEMLARGEIARRFPQFRLPREFEGLYEPNAGFLVPEDVIKAHVGLARRHGAEVRCGEAVESWRAD